MLDVLSEMVALSLTIALAVMVITAFTPLYFRTVDRPFRLNWQRKQLDSTHMSSDVSAFIRPLSVVHHPKVHSIKDKSSADEEAPSFILA
ncbi:hypothetical protein P4637_11520 [Halalkalibacterium halodurans]|uniref:BH1168 protein n=2 Tax=Halalkalibacterium halodurans TaxID=86665 RepID=Q9KDP3_HALH5|nr:hypothetical protein [Halalkalibacterium halodurans]MDY7221695.1 hypothetical protein [Halalkalibacterium halodurans]MDY7240971.1 hypothetical protein [Halalkalibacterium halodurans]MED3647461.1 hypothetical protein [Halalkalibacterium halodurans]MED4079369.1 hypothetical protein [Halalkalibacterium halodurans]MED4085440.1 hypothetical protein [Halalkalibacterium halodurans]